MVTVASTAFRRMQHASTKRGALERMFNLASLSLHTAGMTISIPGLRPEVAEQLRDRTLAEISKHTATDEARTTSD